METKTFVGSAKIVTTKFGELTKVSFSEQDIETLKSCLIKGWVNCLIKEKKNKVEGKATHYLEIDNWKLTEPFKKDNNETKYTPKIDEDSLPFQSIHYKKVKIKRIKTIYYENERNKTGKSIIN